MTNPFSYVFRTVKTYAKDLKNAPAAQYVTKTAAPSVTPSLTSIPPPAYQRDARPSSPSWSVDESLEKGQPTVAVSPFEGKPKKKSSGAFDFVVKMAGSRWSFLVTLLLIAAWAVLGAVYGPTDTWQVILQDTSSIQCYISATLLMRQQQNATRSLLDTICGMISRSKGNERMLRQLSQKQLAKLKRSQRSMRQDLASALGSEEGLFDRFANAMSKALGSLGAVGVYWAGIIVWVAWGVPLQWSNTWQLYVNTATALELTFTTMFLQSVRRQHEDYLGKCLKSIDIVDRDLEMELRRMTGDLRPNPVVESQPPTLSWIEKAIDVWAFVVGGSVGVFLSVSVFIAWLAVGDMMKFDDNWWLIIGTFTGLMGFIDSFVLRNVHHRETLMADKHFELLVMQDFRLFYMLDIPFPEDHHALGGGADRNKKLPLNERVSRWIGHVCAVAQASVASVLIVVALLAVASAMQWSETGQLLCNTPTMIVEGFLLLMLINGHNSAENKRRAQYTDILTRRLMLDRRVASWEDKDFELEVELLDEKGIDVWSVTEKYDGAV